MLLLSELRPHNGNLGLWWILFLFWVGVRQGLSRPWMGPLGPLWGMGKGHLLHLTTYCEAEGHKTSSWGVVAGTEISIRRSGWTQESSCGSQSRGSGRQEAKDCEVQNEPEAAVRPSRNKDGICPFTPPLWGIFKEFLLPTWKSMYRGLMERA